MGATPHLKSVHKGTLYCLACSGTVLYRIPTDPPVKHYKEEHIASTMMGTTYGIIGSTSKLLNVDVQAPIWRIMTPLDACLQERNELQAASGRSIEPVCDETIDCIGCHGINHQFITFDTTCKTVYQLLREKWQCW